MKTSEQVNKELASWLKSGMSKPETIVRLAEACLGWPYVWGGYGQACTVKNREAYANRSACPSSEASVIRSKCQQLRSSNKKKYLQWMLVLSKRFNIIL